jgi:arylsulfatase A-like enzyme
MLVRWPAKIRAGKKSNGIQDHTDLFTTLAAAAGEADLHNKLRSSHQVYIDGVNNLDHWTGDVPSKRNFEIYYNENDLTAVRIGNWKSHIKTREGFFDFNEPSALLINLRQDPFEKHTEWKSREVAMKLGIAWGGQVQDLLGAHMKTLIDFPPRQKGGTLTPGQK